MDLRREGSLSRRDLLKYLAAAAAAGRVSVASPASGALRLLLGNNEALESIVGTCTPTFAASVLRRDDLLSVRFEFFNLVLLPGSRPQLVRERDSLPAYVVARLGAQAIAEQAFFEGGGSTEGPGDLPVRTLLSGDTRLAFRVPDDVAAIDYRLPALLDWVTLDPNVVPVATAPDDLPQPLRRGPGLLGIASVSPAVIREPECTETAIEMPWHLTISPHAGSAWAHSAAPVVHQGRTELWHTRLGTRRVVGPLRFVDETPGDRTVRAVWCTGFSDAAQPAPKTASPCGAPEDSDEVPFRMTLSRRDRYEIVRRTSDFTRDGYTPQPVRANRLMLSSLGAWLDVRGTWDNERDDGRIVANGPPGDLSLEEWSHHATMGRDHFVRVVSKGYLLPFGHPASFVKVTQRRIERGVAVLRQRKFIIVRDQVKDLAALDRVAPSEGRAMPFRRVTLTTTVTPDIADPTDDSRFWVEVGPGTDLKFPCVAEDWAGVVTEFSAPLMFVNHCVASNDMEAIRTAYNTPGPAFARRTLNMGGQKISVAQTKKVGDTELEVARMILRAEAPTEPGTLDEFGHPPVIPVMAGAQVSLAAVRQVSGQALDPFIRLRKQYLDEGFAADDPTAPEIYAELTDPTLQTLAPAGLMFSKGDQAGGIVNPNMSVAGLSRNFGPVGGGPNAADTSGALETFETQKRFEPAKYFAGAKLLGGLDLASIVKAAGVDEAGGKGVPKVVTQTEFATSNQTGPASRITTTIDWTPEPQQFAIFFLVEGQTSMRILGRFVTDLVDQSASTYDIEGRLETFKLQLFGADPFLILDFDRLIFTARTGAKPDVDVEISKVTFAGELSFINELQRFLQTAGKQYGIETQPGGITIRTGIELPKVNIGAFSLQKMSFSVSVELPFNGDPLFARFAFCSKENPFIVTYSFLGGGGYVELEIAADTGVRRLEVSFEIGAHLSLEIGDLASGSVHASAGIRLTMVGDQVILAGFVDLKGELEVLGVITVSVHFHMEISYSSTGEAVGRATLTIRVDVAIVHETVELSVERRLAGSKPESSQAPQAALASPAEGETLPMYGEERAYAEAAAVSQAAAQTFEALYPQESWTTYCNRFATA